MKNITNVSVRAEDWEHQDGRRKCSVQCDHGGFHYHIWGWTKETPEGVVFIDEEGTLYKNSDEPKIRTRHLDRNAAFGSKLIPEMLAQARAGQLFSKAVEEAKGRAQAERAKRRAGIKEAEKKSAAPVMFSALLHVEEILSLEHVTVKGSGTDLTAGLREVVRVALDHADPERPAARGEKLV